MVNTFDVVSIKVRNACNTCINQASNHTLSVVDEPHARITQYSDRQLISLGGRITRFVTCN